MSTENATPEDLDQHINDTLATLDGLLRRHAERLAVSAAAHAARHNAETDWLRARVDERLERAQRVQREYGDIPVVLDELAICESHHEILRQYRTACERLAHTRALPVPALVHDFYRGLGAGRVGALLHTVRAVALAYRHHPEYQAETWGWKA